MVASVVAVLAVAAGLAASAVSGQVPSGSQRIFTPGNDAIGVRAVAGGSSTVQESGTLPRRFATYATDNDINTLFYEPFGVGIGLIARVTNGGTGIPLGFTFTTSDRGEPRDPKTVTVEGGNFIDMPAAMAGTSQWRTIYTGSSGCVNITTPLVECDYVPISNILRDRYNTFRMLVTETSFQPASQNGLEIAEFTLWSDTAPIIPPPPPPPAPPPQAPCGDCDVATDSPSNNGGGGAGVIVGVIAALAVFLLIAVIAMVYFKRARAGSQMEFVNNFSSEESASAYTGSGSDS